MVFVPCPNTAEVTVKQTHLSEKAVNVYHVEAVSSWDQAKLQELAEAFVTWWETETRTERAVQACLEEVCARDLTTASGLSVCIPHGLVNCGAATGDALPGNVTIAIKEGTGLAGRANRGRSYWVGLSEGHVTGNQIVPATATAIIGNMNELSARVNDLGHTLVVVSKMLGSSCNIDTCKRIPTPRSACVTTPITGYAIEANMDSQRRRLPGRGS